VSRVSPAASDQPPRIPQAAGPQLIKEDDIRLPTGIVVPVAMTLLAAHDEGATILMTTVRR
jgi:hypothetical protein